MNRYSIILPVRNGGSYVRDCVHSVLAQTYRDFNFHILDNGSTDGTLEWLRSLKDDRIILTEAPRPLTIEESWARITGIPKNEFITLIGHDDLLDPDYLGIMDVLISQNPDAALYQAHFRLIDAEGKEIRPCKQMPGRQTAPEFLTSVLQNRYDLFGTGYMLRSKDYDEAGGLPDYPNLLFADFELWMKLTTKSYKATSPKTCFSYRVHQSTTKVSGNDKVFRAFARFISYLAELKTKDPAIAKVIQEDAPSFLLNYCKSFAHRLLRTPAGERKGRRVDEVVANFSVYARDLGLGPEANPRKYGPVKLASFIDSSFITRQLFLLFKKIYRRPVSG